VNVDPNSHVPIYVQIANQMRAAIAAGVYQAGEPLPSLRAMALQVHVNPNTVHRAYDELLRAGTIYAQRGKGLYVADRGVAAAVDAAQQTVTRGLTDVIRAARTAGISTADIRRLFAHALRNDEDPHEAES